MFDNIFGGIGKGCASHPWEVIVGVLTVTACMLSMDKTSDSPSMSAVPNNLHNTKIVVSIILHLLDVFFRNPFYMSIQSPCTPIELVYLSTPTQRC